MKTILKEYVARYNELAEKYGFPATSELEVSEVDLCEEMVEFFKQFSGKVLAENDLYEIGLIEKEDASEFAIM